jgi:two-component system cell cycle sensor histidine kinase/response regulator CckA
MPRRKPRLPAPADFHRLFESAPGLYLVLDPKLTIVAASDAYLAATMTERDAILGRDLFDVFPDNPDDPAATGEANLKSSLARVLALRRADVMAVQKYDIRKPEAEGGGFEVRHWSPVNSPVLGKDGAVVYIIHRVEDVTEFVRLKEQDREQHELAEELRTRADVMEAEIYRRAQELQEANRQLRELQAGLEERVRVRTTDLRRSNDRLAESEAHYRLLFEGSPQPMWVYDRTTLAFLAVNAAACQHYGYTADEFRAMTLADIRPPEDVARLHDDIARMRDDLVPGREWRHRRKDGSLIAVEIASHLLKFGGRDAALVLATDVTRRRQLEDELRQSQKMEAVGLLAGGVAHDFNNLLTAIMGYAQLMRPRLAADPTALADADEILRAAERAANLTRQLLAFSRQQVLEPRVIDLNTIVTDLDRMIRRLIGEDIDLLSAAEAGLGCVRVDRGQIEQVLMNLVVNARDAMPGGGKLTLETANVEIDARHASAHPGVAPGRFVMVAVSDTGCGMNAETVSRIFEPFFTTKETGRGTGLGLSTVHGIVKQSGGHIEVYSEVGNGTTFKVYLPRVDEAAATAPTASPPCRRTTGGETVLLVEDEAVIRRVVVQALTQEGYRVLAVEDGASAITLCEEGANPIDLLITDVVMPLMSGPQLVQRVASRRPEMSILYISGYTDRALIHQGQREAGSDFLQKPFTPETLAHKVRAILDRRLRQAA